LVESAAQRIGGGSRDCEDPKAERERRRGRQADEGELCAL